MIKKRGAHNYRFNPLGLGISLIIVLVLILIVLPPEYKYSKSKGMFEQGFIKDDFNVIDGSKIKFFDAGVEVEDFLLINGREYRIDKERIEGILIRKESTNDGKKIVYGLRNEGNDKEIQFVWKSNIPVIYDRANGFDLNKDFITDSEIIKFYSNDTYKSYITFKDVGEAFGGVSLSYDADTRTLIASSEKIKLKKGWDIIMDPGVETVDPPTPANGTITSNPDVEINISIEEGNLYSFIWNWNGTNYTFYGDSVVLAMNFEDNVEDLSDYGNDGVNYGAAYTEGKYGKALGLDGIDDYVDIDDKGSLDLDIFSIEFWFKPDDDYGVGGSYMGLIYGDNYGIYMENGKMIFDYKGSKVESLTNEWDKDEWYHILATYDGEQRIYVNGLKENSVIVSAPFTVKNNLGGNVAFFLNSGNVVLKGNCNAGSCPYPGRDAFVIYDSVGETVAYIDDVGNLCVEDNNCNDGDASCSKSNEGLFVIGATGEIVSSIDLTGKLCLIGSLIEESIS